MTTQIAPPPQDLTPILPSDFTPNHPYLQDPAARLLHSFFTTKTLPTLKAEDRAETFYHDFLAYQAQHHLYASLLSPAQYSSQGNAFHLLRYARFLELFAYLSPAHGYSLQVSFLGLFSILQGTNDALKLEAVHTLEAGHTLAFAISEQAHGSDLLANEFAMTPTSDSAYLAHGSKYYIGNANTAAIVSILGHQTRVAASQRDGRPQNDVHPHNEHPANNDRPHHDRPHDSRPARQPFLLIALRPPTSPAYHNVTKIPTLGIRSAFVGSFDVTNHPFPHTDIIARGRDAFDAVLNTVTLGKFFLGFGSIGICQHAYHEALAHLRSRTLYGKPVLDMPHIRALMHQAYLRLAAMKLYAYRTLDYLHAANESDRRYQLYCAVQKAKVSTQAVKVIALISECTGARGFEADTFLEMALRDIQLIPGLEGSLHINLRQTTQFAPQYFHHFNSTLPHPPSLTADPSISQENPYLYHPDPGHIRTISFRPLLEPFRPLSLMSNVLTFARQTTAFRRLIKAVPIPDPHNSLLDISLGHLMATIVYAHQIAEHATLLNLPPDLTSQIFAHLVTDLSESALALTTIPELTDHRPLILPLIKPPQC